MNRYLILTVVALGFLCPVTYAQIGFKGGINRSSIVARADDIHETNSITGWQAGVMLKVPVHPWFFIQPEIMYIRKGSKYQFQASDVELNIHYVEVPVLAVLKPGGGVFGLEVGPQFSYLANAKTTFTNGSFGEMVTIDENRDNYEPFDVGLVLGAGLHFNKFLVDLRFTRGFHSVDKVRMIGNTEYSSNARNYNFQASLGVFF